MPANWNSLATDPTQRSSRGAAGEPTRRMRNPRLIDGVGYLAAILSGSALGKLLDLGGYRLGFGVLAAVTVTAAALAVALRPAEGRLEKS